MYVRIGPDFFACICECMYVWMYVLCMYECMLMQDCTIIRYVPASNIHPYIHTTLMHTYIMHDHTLDHMLDHLFRGPLLFNSQM